MWWMLSSVAMVHVDDPSGCVDGARLEDELTLLFTDNVLSELYVTVEVSTEEDEHRASLQVHQHGSLLWSRLLVLQAGDCPSAPEAAAISIQRGLAALPGWEPEGERRRNTRGAIDFTAHTSPDLDTRFELGGGGSVRLTGRTWIWARVRAGTSAPLRIGQGRATLLTVGVAVGIRGVLKAGGSGFELAAGMAGGPMWALGQGFDTNRTSAIARTSLEGSLSWLAPGPFRVGLLTEFPLIRLVLVESGGDARTEAPLRAGISLGLRL